ncbi:MAG: T9SS type A sorting domain-containing protein [Bacteroidales bacterium]|nr:T9SS type A sorting domain-containing protein [Bacteroidales bacterium]
MKKLFTLTLALSMAVAGFSQVARTSLRDAKVAQMKKAPRMETLTNIQSQPNMTRINYEEGELDYTTYDWQSNQAQRTWTIVWSDGKVNFAYTMATDNSYSDRGTGIGTFDSNTGEWTPCEGRVENEKTGFGSIARYLDNSIIVAAHTATEMGIYYIEDKDNITPGCAETVCHLENSKSPTWPAIMTSGANRDIVHVVALGYDDNQIYYYRSKDGGKTWDKENVILPFLTAEYGSDWGSNCYYWMETTEDNCLALVINNAWSDGMVLYSYDDGDTWERKVYYHHPGINTTFTDPTGENIIFMYPRYVSAQWGIGGELCMVYEWNGSTGEPGSNSYYPALGGVAFWGENLPYTGPEGNSYYQGAGYDPTNPMPATPGQPFILDSAYINGDLYAAWPRWSDQSWDNPVYFGYLAPLDANDEWQNWAEAESFNIEDFTLHGSYNGGIVCMPVLCTLPGSNGYDMVAVYSMMDEHNTDGNGKYYFKLFATYSGDGGRTWSTPIHLTNDFMFQYSEFVYSQAAVIGGKLIIAAQEDGLAGSYVQEDDETPDDNLYRGLVFDLAELFPNAGVGLEEQTTTQMSIFPNPAVGQLNVSLSKSAKITVYNTQGQVVKTQEGHIGGNVIDLNNLTSGIYFINADNNTQKFIVK